MVRQSLDRPDKPSRPDLGDGHVGVFSEEAEDCGIDVAAARTHHEAFQRGQSHAGIA